MRIAIPGFRLDRWRLIAHWYAVQAQRYAESILGRPMTQDEASRFVRHVRNAQRRAA